MSLTIVVLDTRFLVEEARRYALRVAGEATWRGAVEPERVEEILQLAETLREQGLHLTRGEEAVLDLSTTTIDLQDFITPAVPDLHGHSSFAILPVSEATSRRVKELHESFVDSVAWKLMEMGVRFYVYRVGEA